MTPPDRALQRLVIAALLLIFASRFAHGQDADAVGEPAFLFGDEAEQTTPPADPPWWKDIRTSGYLKNETAYRYREPRSITKIRNVVYLNATYPYSPRLRFNFAGWAYYDLAYDLFDYETIAARLEREEGEPLAFVVNLPQEKDSPVAEARELYLDWFGGDVDVRLGKQFIVWGVLEGVRIVDEVNPLDFRELVMPELLDYRIPLWSLKADWYRDKASYELIWIPDVRFHKPAPRGSEWEFLQEVPGTRYPDRFDPKNSEIGYKVSTNLWDTELSFSYFYTWDDYPVIFRHVQLNSAAPPEFLPTYTRISMYGATFIKQLWNIILKGELAFVTGKYFAIDNLDENGDGFLDSNGEFKRNHIRWGLGVDFNWLGADISPSITQWIILNYHDAMIQDKYDTGVNLFIRKDMPEKSIVFQFLAMYLVNMEELYMNPQWTFRVTDRFSLTAGLDLFYGRKASFGVGSNASAVGGVEVIEQRAQFFGEFHDNDRVFMEFKYAF